MNSGEYLEFGMKSPEISQVTWIHWNYPEVSEFWNL